MGETSTRSERGPYAKSAARRREILESALDLFAARGFEGTSLTAIGAAVGASREGLRHYFTSREDLLLAVMATADERSRARFGDRPDTPVMEALADSARFNMSVPGLVSLYISLVATAAASTNVVSRDFFQQRFTSLRDAIAQAVEHGQACGQIRQDLSPAVMASLILGASDGLSMQWLLDDSIDITEGLHLLQELMRPPT